MAVVSLLGVVFNLIRMTARGWHRKEYMLLTPEAISWMSREIGYHEHRWANVAGVTRRRPNALPSLVGREGRSATEIAEGYLPTDMSKAEFAAILAVAHRSATATPADRPPLARHV